MSHNHVSRRTFLKTAATGTASGVFGANITGQRAQGKAKSGRPNLVYIFAD